MSDEPKTGYPPLPPHSTTRIAIEAACRDMWGSDYDDDEEQMYYWMRTAIREYNKVMLKEYNHHEV